MYMYMFVGIRICIDMYKIYIGIHMHIYIKAATQPRVLVAAARKHHPRSSLRHVC